MSAPTDASTEPSRLASLLAALCRTIREPAAPAVGDELDAWLARQRVDAADRAVLGAADPKRLFVYRKLVRKGLSNAIAEEIPLTRARLGDRFDAEVSAFFDEAMPRSHYLRDVAFELVEWARPRWTGDPTLPPFLGDLATHELSAFEVAAARATDASTPAASPELALDRPVVLHASTRLRRYGFPVHRLAESDTDLAPAVTALLVYRDAEHEVRYLELTPLAAGIVDRLLANATLGAAITEACTALGAGLSIEESARFFADLAERGVLLGAR